MASETDSQLDSITMWCREMLMKRSLFDVCTWKQRVNWSLKSFVEFCCFVTTSVLSLHV
jgi:hypothetical protein